MAIDSLYLYLTTLMFTIIIFGILIFTIYILCTYGFLSKYGLTVDYMNILGGALILSVILYIVRKKYIQY
jgi:hypothetical protein